MKQVKVLRELLMLLEQERKIYHSTSGSFKKFLSRPTWFATNERDGKAWHENGVLNHEKQVTLICLYQGEKIASIKQTEEIAKQVWPGENLIYSMFDANVGEYPTNEIKQFIKLLEKAGFEAAYIDDYDPENFNGNSNTVSLCIFDPAETVTITGVLKKTDKLKKKPAQGFVKDYIQKDSYTAADFKMGERVLFKDSGLSPHEGEIIKIVKKGEKLPKVAGIDYTIVNADSKPGVPAYSDRIYVRTFDNHDAATYEIPLWMTVGKKK